MNKIIPGILLVLLITSCSNENRYELVQASQKSSPMLVDKKTGTVWVLYSGRWKNWGTPPKEAPEKGNSFNINQ